jgi:hypothetical protein
MNHISYLIVVLLSSKFETSWAVSNSRYFDLSSLSGNNGFTLNGISASGYAGSAVSGAGDVNGDGIDDFLGKLFFLLLLHAEQKKCSRKTIYYLFYIHQILTLRFASIFIAFSTFLVC